MSGSHPRTVSVQVPPAAIDGDTVLVAFRASSDVTIATAEYIPVDDITGAATDNRKIEVVNAGADGTGTTVVLEEQFVSGVDFAGLESNALDPSGTEADLEVAAGDLVLVKSTSVGTGIVDPGGVVNLFLT